MGHVRPAGRGITDADHGRPRPRDEQEIARDRYLAFHPAVQFAGYAEKVEDRSKDQIEYVNEDPFIRQKFESELAQRGQTSLMPDAAYTDPSYEWTFQAGEVADSGFVLPQMAGENP